MVQKWNYKWVNSNYLSYAPKEESTVKHFSPCEFQWLDTQKLCNRQHFGRLLPYGPYCEAAWKCWKLCEWSLIRLNSRCCGFFRKDLWDPAGLFCSIVCMFAQGWKVDGRRCSSNMMSPKGDVNAALRLKRQNLPRSSFQQCFVLHYFSTVCL